MSALIFVLISAVNLVIAVLLNKALRRGQDNWWRMMISIAYNGPACGAYIGVMKRGRFLDWYVLPATGFAEVLIGVVTFFMVLFHAWICVHLRERDPG